jgi:hypothetical protein
MKSLRRSRQAKLARLIRRHRLASSVEEGPMLRIEELKRLRTVKEPLSDSVKSRRREKKR